MELQTSPIFNDKMYLFKQERPSKSEKKIQNIIANKNWGHSQVQSQTRPADVMPAKKACKIFLIELIFLYHSKI